MYFGRGRGQKKSHSRASSLMKQANRPVRVAAVMPQRRSDVVVAGQAEDANDGVADRGHHLRTVAGPDGGAGPRRT